MYSKILVPLDGSKLSESVIPYARALAKALAGPASAGWSSGASRIEWFAIREIRC